MNFSRNSYQINSPEPRRSLTIGIDVGGTNTDAVLYDNISNEIVRAIKTPTFHIDYEKSIDTSVRHLLHETTEICCAVSSFNISTTLATNALLEGRVDPVNLILIGFKEYKHITDEIRKTIKPYSVLYVEGGHTGAGKQKAPLGRLPLEAFVNEHKGEMFSVSAMYSPRNPEHEIQARDIILSSGCSNVTCGYELANSRLNAVKRTVTAYLNTSLISLTERLISGVERVAEKNGLTCPIMFLRSDSSLASSDWCRKFPIETIFSGPAASLAGAQFFVKGESDLTITVADMGGTSTDIGNIVDGKAVFSEDGATVGPYRTMVPSLNIRTIALGGDSFVKLDNEGNISVGPERSLPLCRAPEILQLNPEEIKTKISQSANWGKNDKMHYILYAEHNLNNDGSLLFSFLENKIYNIQETLAHLASLGFTAEEAVAELNAARRKGIVVDCTYTPTDAVNVLGLACIGDSEISRTASLILGKNVNLGGTGFARNVYRYVKKLLESEIFANSTRSGKFKRIYLGSPAKSFAPVSSDTGMCILPENGSVSGAIGAATSSLRLFCSMSIMHNFSDEIFTAFLPTETKHSKNIDDLLAKSEYMLKKYLTEQASLMGFSETEVIIDHEYVYLNKVKKPSTLLSVLLRGSTIVKNAQ